MGPVNKTARVFEKILIRQVRSGSLKDQRRFVPTEEIAVERREIMRLAPVIEARSRMSS